MAVALLPFVLLEAALRCFPGPQHVVVADSAYDPDPLVDLHQLRPLFEPVADGTAYEIGASRRNFFQPARFAADKPVTGRRIFVVGGSTVQGRPYATQTAFAELLKVQLQTAWPDIHWEVVNCGGVSYASYRVAAVVDEVLEHQADLIVVYTGHNEFLESRTYAVQRRLPRGVAAVVEAGTRLRIVQWPVACFGREPPPRTTMAAEVDAILDHRQGLAGYRRDSQHRQQVAEHFRHSLQRICRATRTAGVPLVLFVPASDSLSVPPFKTAVPPTADAELAARIEGLWKTARDPTLDGDRRVAACRQLLELDPHHAGAAYMWGRQLWERERYEQAARWLLVARDHDVCPLRATSQLATIVRDVAQQNRVPLIDVPQRFADPRAPALCRATTFVDHVHPRVFEGHWPLANALYDQIVTTDLLDVPPPQANADQRSTAVQEYLNTIPESYYQRGQQRLAGLKRWAAGRGGVPLEPTKEVFPE